MTPSEMIIANSRQLLKVVDRTGRTITVKRINALDRLRLLKAAGPELSQNDAWLNLAALAMSVIEINGAPRVTPINERQIEAAIMEIGDHGLQAVAESLSQSDETALLFDGSSEGNAVGTPT